MYGNGMGTLNVRSVGAGGTGETIFTKGGSDMGDMWNDAFVNVITNDVEFHVSNSPLL